MVHITEMRVLLPMTVNEFKRGQRFSNFKTNELNTSEGQGGQLLSTLPYENEIWGEGIYTHSLYRLGDRLPDWVTRLVPSNALIIDEKTWMAFPYVRTTISIPFFNKLKIEMVSMHANDNGSTENIHNLTEAELAIRKVDMIDIAFDDIPNRDYRAELDPKLYVSKKTGRGPLRKGWLGNTVPTMCAYKLVKVEANYWGVQSRAEKLMTNGIRQIVLLTHRNAFCWLDEWFDLTFEEICARESLGRERLKATVKQPPVIDPRTGQEVILEPEGPSQDTTDDSDETSDIEAEYFEAEMELGNLNAGQLVTKRIPAGNDTVITQPSDVPDRCAVCATRDISDSPPSLFCTTCQEYFCQRCFTEFHVTTRLKAHTIQHLLNSFVSLDSRKIVPVDKENAKKDAGLPPVRVVLQKSTSDMSQFKRTLNNGHSIDSPARELGAQDHTWISRATSKLRRIKSGFSVLNEIQCTDGVLLQDNSQPDVPPMRAATSNSDANQLSYRPNELSEELVRTVASLHQRAAESCSLSALARSTSQAFASSKRNFGRRPSQDLTDGDIMVDHKGERLAIDPYDVKEGCTARDIGVYANSLDVTVLPTESQIKAFVALYQRLHDLLELLKLVKPENMHHKERLSFWINIYNTLVLHAFLTYGAPKNHYKRVSLMDKVAYIVGAHKYSPPMIEHSILRSNSYRPALASLFPIIRVKKPDEHVGPSLDRPEPLVSFALCCGSRSSPVMRVYTATNIDIELEEACRDFLMAAVSVHKKKTVVLPKLLHLYVQDFSHDAESLIEWIAAKLPHEKRLAFDECKKKRSSKGIRHRVSVQPYDWTFRYLYDPSLLRN
ncbi:uncharacterized protein [Physcomitrium patens]|uniref:uncharacterized protein isoform X3 n=1 Tax=Physcomitrium patens TaxID=3218 RepID=UPI000D17ACF3|nr:uncharacterized protein LOC112279243 isoform X1 [Physcomitrium patens]XP_024369227.1 uncharacterized protein LOC112279243 isoform X1 [Physcomitrium patens]XP_024369228.1 uncharacterized protein LOC112279243 isoform X1 [Physcomitrium patens]XP_024369229.1 uncharacterized protein LOC112279243 isoform X1 [Physcomitrium patens]XP_024369230.1 uncharacterized protein LOC112279243 isoform X1 [Physcomitrium patens]XP_024369231.1 uncharacterized protein LOC112279243 isoform X1 [Physcomitrium patens]|eukprot:XP_024369225.1 uncharacterized protein LOC112279243 isoform X1 [Physcomitrella patens]